MKEFKIALKVCIDITYKTFLTSDLQGQIKQSMLSPILWVIVDLVKIFIEIDPTKL